MTLALQGLAEQHRIAQVRSSARVEAAIAQVWRRSLMGPGGSLDANFPRYVRDASIIIGAGRRISHEHAARYYRASRVAAGFAADGRVDLLPPPLDPERAVTVLRVTGPVEIKRRLSEGEAFSSATRAALALTLGDVKRLSLEAGRSSLIAASARDPRARGWARLSDGSPCAFCAMLVSRGPVYTQETADFHAHGRCGCTVAFVWEGGGDGWTPEARALRELWDRTGDLNAFRTGLRESLVNPRSPVSAAYAAKFAALGEPEWLQRHRQIIDRLPADRSSIGVRGEGVTSEAARQEALDAAARAAGGTPDEIRAVIAKQREHLAGIESLIEDFSTKGLYDLPKASDLPADVRARLKALGFSTRKRPGAIEADLFASRNAQAPALARAETALRNLEATRASIMKHEYPSRTRRVDDLLPDGSLGPTTAKVLDDVIEAGRVLDEEIERRVRAEVGDLAALRHARDAARVDFENAYRAHLDAYDDLGEANAALRQKAERLRQRMRDASDALDRATSLQADAYSRAAREVLAQVRPMGGPGVRWDGPGDLIDRMQTAEQNYPTEWLDRLRAEAPEWKVIENARGYNNFSQRTIALSDGRGSAVATHELGHSMEDVVPGLRGMEWAFHYRRVAVAADGRTALPALEDIGTYRGDTPGVHAEWAFPNRGRWADTYSGKTYRPFKPDKAGADVSWEVFTTGVESVFDGSRFFRRHGKTDLADGTDVEFRRLILGVLSAL